MNIHVSSDPESNCSQNIWPFLFPVYTCHSVKRLFLMESQISFRSVGSGSENWLKSKNGAKEHDSIGKTALASWPFVLDLFWWYKLPISFDPRESVFHYQISQTHIGQSHWLPLQPHQSLWWMHPSPQLLVVHQLWFFRFMKRLVRLQKVHSHNVFIKVKAII